MTDERSYPDTRVLKLIVRRPGGNASKGAFGYHINIPTAWVTAIGCGPGERDCKLTFDGEKIIIEKSKKAVDTESRK